MPTPNKPQLILCENARLLITAIMAVMIIRFFCLEPYKIPSASMEPTLIGDPACGDQLLANKFIYHFQEPQRWEVAVFKYPLDSKRNFIKRIIGLPGEEVTIKNGNIYIAGKIVRKPAQVQAAVLYPLWSPEQATATRNNVWETAGGLWQWDQAGKEIVVVRAEAEAWCTYAKEINNEYVPRQDRWFFKRLRPYGAVGGGMTVGEFLLSFQVTPRAPGTLLAKFWKGNERFSLALSAGDTAGTGLLLWEQNGVCKKSLPLNFTLQCNRQYLVEISNLDELFCVQVDAHPLAEMACETPLDEVPSTTFESKVQWGVKQGVWEFQKICLWRDIYYLGRRDLFAGASSWTVPAQHYFVLGDNPPYSSDSRDWKVFQVTLQSGICLEGDQQNSPSTEGDLSVFTDVYGIARAIPTEQIKTIVSNVETPFVPRHHFVGKAFNVFWPPTRMKLIR